MYYYKDEDGSVKTTDVFAEADQFECGSVLPKLYGGFGTSLRLYGFDIAAQFSFQLGGKYYDGTYQKKSKNSVFICYEYLHPDQSFHNNLLFRQELHMSALLGTFWC